MERHRVVVVDAADERREDDQFPGVGVIEQIRKTPSSTETTILVLTGHYFHPALRRRMREAQADFFYHRSELQSAAALPRRRPSTERCPEYYIS
jgi:hypothetical protein